MISFEILARSTRSRARRGILHTPHGEIETPAFVPVATRASVRGLPSVMVRELGSQLLICNTYHLHLTPGEGIVADAGGLHEFMQWERPLMTDSGGFQVFSMGFGTDHGVGKILKEAPSARIEEGSQPANIKITDEGVHFRSPRDGAKLFLGPRESIAIQEKLGADIMFAFDECPSPLSDAAYLRTSLERTHRWARECLETREGNRALYGIVQGGSFDDLRAESARIIGALPFDGFGIGGEFGYDKASLAHIVSVVNDLLPENKPRHLLGVGHPEDLETIVESGVDTFDCIAPTHYARHGVAFTSQGRVNLRSRALLQEHTALDLACSCPVCASYSRAYIAHLVQSNELTGLALATMHNLFFMNERVRQLREHITSGRI